MPLRLSAILLAFLALSVAISLPTTSVAAPATDSDQTVQATPPASSPATKPAKHFPTPGEIIEQLKAQATAKDHLIKVGYIHLDRPIVEKPDAFSFLGESTAVTIHNLIERLRMARDDKKLKALLITFGDTQFNLAQAQEIRDVLVELKKAGKRVFVYADAYDTDTYTAASGASDICILGGGEMEMPGIGLQTMFAKGLLDKVGVQADYVQIGEYKGADEEYTRTEPSPELRGELNKLVDSLYGVIVGNISKYRNITSQQAKDAIDQAILTAHSALERKLVDHLLDQDELPRLLKDELGGEINLERGYGEPARQKIDISNPWAFLALLLKKPAVSDKPAVALIHAEGVIVDGDSEDSLFGGNDNVGSENIRKAFRLAVRDENVKAIVLRIDSPGGSALASEVMWQAARHAADKKPLIISVGSMAASGGYYLASSGDYIFADPSAIVGSIGVVGGKFVLKDLFAKIGLNTETFARGSNAALFSSTEPFTEKQRNMVKSWMTETYDQFTKRVMTNRAGKIKEIDKVARGRVFIAKEARDLGMVDALGGLEDAIAYAATEGGLKPGTYDVKNVPVPKTLADLFSGGAAGDEDSSMPIRPRITIAPDSVLRALPSAVRHVVTRQLQVLQLLQQRPVMLVCPYTVTVK